MDWAYFVPIPLLTLNFRPHGDNKFELIIMVSRDGHVLSGYKTDGVSLAHWQSRPDLPLPVINTQVDGHDGYATSDLLEPHPTKPGLWRIFGRADEQIMLSNGEKVRLLSPWVKSYVRAF